MSERFYIHCADDNNKQLFDTESDFNIHIEEVGSDEELIQLCDLLNEQQATINKLEERDYYNQSERYKILGRAIELASGYIHRNDLEYYDFCGLVTEFEKELLDNGK